MNIYQKLIELQKSTETFVKDAKSYAYKYVSGSQVLSAVKEMKDKLGLLLVPEVSAITTEKIEKNYQIRGTMQYKWINAENPEETLTVNWALFGQQDDISKAFGSALTYSERYFLLKFLGIPTDDEDPDAKVVEKPKAPARQEARQEVEEKPKAPVYKTADLGKPSKWAQLKELAAKNNTDMNSIIAKSRKLFGTDMLNNLTEAQFNKLVDEIQPKNIAENLTQVDFGDLPF